MFAGAIVLLFLAGTVALLAGRALYGDRLAGRVAVGVVLPKEDALAKQMVSMISSLDSVKDMCDFRYMEREESLDGLRRGELSAVMEMPEDLIEGIMDGTNPEVSILLPENAWLESSIFKELTEAGAKILGSSQAGIYAGNELYITAGRQEEIQELEQDLNRIFLSYSLPREDYFRHLRVGGTGDVEVPVFYGISAYVLFLLLLAIPVSGYLLPFSPVMQRKLSLAGAGSKSRVLGRIVGLGSLFFTMSAVMGILVWKGFRIFGPERHFVMPDTGGFFWITILMVCMTAAALIVLIYQAAGTLLGGIMLLFLTVTAQHFLAGGFLPEVFLPEILRKLVPVMPSAILMDGVKMAVIGAWSKAVAGKLLFLLIGCFFLTAVLERWEERRI